MSNVSEFSVKFQADLAKRAAANKKRIVLPESEDERVLKAAAQVLSQGSADIVLLGEEAQILADAQRLGIDLSGAQFVSLSDGERIERYAAKLAELRAAKGMTLEKARETLQDVSFFGTMMIVLGEADGMVSGAAHTTAHTIRPALQVIKTKPGTKLVSGAFIMVFDDHYSIFADCAVTINPSAEELADIAKTSAQTAAQFGLDPKVALLSYSTMDSGTGPQVDKVKEAVALARAAAPELALDGPLQFDAAVDATVAAKKAPESAVAGSANVFVFPDLGAGNITYKAVQRLTGCLAIGPVLQGLNAPVNDLSRGALVEDIVNTVVITALQAQG